MTELGFAAVPGIVVICYLVGMAVHTQENLRKFIPIVVGTVGGILGIVALYTVADFAAQDHLNAVAIGIVSGLAATGANQVFQQLKN